MLWSDKHAPARTPDIFGNKKAVATALAWARAWDSGKRQPPLLLHGPPGVGKSSLAKALATEFGWGFMEMNASELRNKDAISRIAGPALSTASLLGPRRLLLIDDADRMFSADRGGLVELTRLISTSAQPLILTALDYWEPKLAPLRQLCKSIVFHPIDAPDVAALLTHITKAEGIGGPSHAKSIVRISESCAGDARSAINDLQALSEGHGTEVEYTNELSSDGTKTVDSRGRRDRSKDIKDALDEMFAASDYAGARRALFDVDVDHDLVLKWIEENAPREFSTPQELAHAFEFLSRAALFDGRAIRRQYYALWRYSGDLMTAGVSFSRRTSVHRPASSSTYQFPKVIRILSQTKISRGTLKSARSKISAALHVSTRRASDYFPLIAALSASKEGRAFLTSRIGLEDSELLFISGTFRVACELPPPKGRGFLLHR